MAQESTHERTDAGRTMGEISHTHPYTGETAGSSLFRRGPAIAADGGRNEACDRSERAMKDVSHTPPNESTDVNRVFERGRQPVENEEE